MKLNIAITMTCIIMSGCGPGYGDLHMEDQCMRKVIFEDCMKSLPAGPQATHYNDWAEVVDQCDSVAHRLSVRGVEQIKKECRP